MKIKMSTRKKAIKSEPISQDCTPVKTTRVRKIDTRRESPLIRNIVESKDTSPDVPYSPVIKAQSDIGWAWKSPIGRLPDSGSGAVTKRRLLNKTPVQKTKQRSKSNSPLNNIQLKRKLIKIDKKDEDSLTSLTSEFQALTEQKEDTSFEKNVLIEEDRLANDMGMAIVKDTKADSFSALMDDDDDCFALLCCSQVVEAKLIENPNKLVFSPVLLNSSMKLAMNEVLTSTPVLCPTPSASPEMKDMSNICKETEKSPDPLHNPHATSTEVANSSLTSSTNNNNHSVLPSSKFKLNIPKILDKNPNCPVKSPPTSISINKQTPPNKLDEDKSNIPNDSFDNVLLSFCDENVDLLSHIVRLPAKNVHSPSRNKDKMSLGTRSNVQNLAANVNDVPRVAAAEISAKAATKSKILPAPVTSNVTEDDFIQPDLLNILDKIDSTSAPRAPSPPFRCTPDEIEKKRRLAKVRLEQKKLARQKDINRLPNPFLKKSNSS